MSFKQIYMEDLEFALSDIGDEIIYGAFSTNGILLNEPTEVLNMSKGYDAVHDVNLTLTIATGSLGALINHSQLTANGTIYQIDRYIPSANGLETKIWLSGVGND